MTNQVLLKSESLDKQIATDLPNYFIEEIVKIKLITNAMNEWGFISQESLVRIGMSAPSFKFKIRRGYVRAERLVLSNPHSS